MNISTFFMRINELFGSVKPAPQSQPVIIKTIPLEGIHRTFEEDVLDRRLTKFELERLKEQYESKALNPARGVWTAELRLCSQNYHGEYCPACVLSLGATSGYSAEEQARNEPLRLEVTATFYDDDGQEWYPRS